MRFIIGHSSSTEQEAAMAEEARLHGDILRLEGVVEAYGGLANKTRSYFRAVGLSYEAEWVVKMDDDVYLMPGRLLEAMRQWGAMGAGKGWSWFTGLARAV
jgi:hypothetical protein